MVTVNDQARHHLSLVRIFIRLSNKWNIKVMAVVFAEEISGGSVGGGGGTFASA